MDHVSRTEAFTGDHQWRSTELVGGEEIDRERAVELMAALVQQHRQGLIGGYAMFDQYIDVLDLDSAREVVDRPLPGVALPIAPHERGRLERTIFARRAKARADLSGDYLYAALFPSRAAVTDLGAAFSVVRRLAGETGTWEVFLRDGEWPPTRYPDQALSLPIAESDVAPLLRRIVRKKTRYFELRYELGPLAKIRLTGNIEEAARVPRALARRADVERQRGHREHHDRDDGDLGADRRGCREDAARADLSQSSFQASVSEARRLDSISSKCDWLQISGGASWMTGSPRSSARQ